MQCGQRKTSNDPKKIWQHRPMFAPNSAVLVASVCAVYIHAAEGIIYRDTRGAASSSTTIRYRAFDVRCRSIDACARAESVGPGSEPGRI